MADPTSAELYEAWMKAKQKADEYLERQNRTQTLRRGDPDGEWRTEGGFYEVDRLHAIAEAAEARYRAALAAGR